MEVLPEDLHTNLSTISHPVSTQIDHSKPVKRQKTFQHDTFAMTGAKVQEVLWSTFPTRYGFIPVPCPASRERNALSIASVPTGDVGYRHLLAAMLHKLPVPLVFFPNHPANLGCSLFYSRFILYNTIVFRQSFMLKIQNRHCKRLLNQIQKYSLNMNVYTLFKEEKMRSKSVVFHGHCTPLKSGTGLHYKQNSGHPESMILISVSWEVFALCSITSWQLC